MRSNLIVCLVGCIGKIAEMDYGQMQKNYETGMAMSKLRDPVLFPEALTYNERREIRTYIDELLIKIKLLKEEAVVMEGIHQQIRKNQVSPNIVEVNTGEAKITIEIKT